MPTVPERFGDPKYGLTRRFPGEAPDAVEVRIREALAAEGFGILSEIDVQETLRVKLGAELRPYRILGACSPALALQAITEEPPIGLLLPCNVVVAADAEGTVVSIADPKAMLAAAERDDLDPVAADARERLSKALAAA